MNSFGRRLYCLGIGLCSFPFQRRLNNLPGPSFVTRFLELPVEEKLGPFEGELEENLQKAVEERGRWQGGERILLASNLLAIILQP